MHQEFLALGCGPIVLFILCWTSDMSNGWVRAPWRRHPRRYHSVRSVYNDDQSLTTGTRATMSDHGESSNILEDKAGHISQELAHRIWDWEQDHRNGTTDHLQRLDYSIRSGLRLVDQMVEDIVRRETQSGRGGGGHSQSSSLYSDLVQEGLTALLDAMTHYRQAKIAEGPRLLQKPDGGEQQRLVVQSPRSKNHPFEGYARKYIARQLAQFLADDAARSLRVPQAVLSVVREARELMTKMQQKGKRPDASWEKVADQLNMPVERLLTYLRLAQRGGVLSMESTVGIVNPLLDDAGSAFADKDDWELEHGLLLDNGQAIKRDEIVEDYLDEMQQREGDDQAWVQEEQIAGPLQEMIPDNEQEEEKKLEDLDVTMRDDMIVEEMIRSNLPQFLSSTLEPSELAVVRATFGLDSGRMQPAKKTASDLGMATEKVSILLTRAIQKLRAAYVRRYVGTTTEDDDNEPIVDSV